MSKIIALYINELSKIFRKASTLVILVLIVAACFAPPVFFKLAAPIITGGVITDYESISLEDTKKQAENSLKDIDEELSTLDQSEGSEMKRTELLQARQDILTSLEFCEFLIASGYTNDQSKNFLYDAANKIYEFRGEIRNIESIPVAERTQWHNERLIFCTVAIVYIKTLPQSLDFRGYIDLLKDNAASVEKMPGSQSLVTGFKKVIRSLELIYRADPTGGTDGTYNYPAAVDTATINEQWKDELDKGYSVKYTMNGERAEPLTPERRTFLENSIAIMEHRILTDSQPQGTDHLLAYLGKSTAVSAAKFFAAVLVIMAAGSAVSQEIATGSIKSLIIAPVRRWKIFTAKLLALLTLLITSLLLVSILSSLSVMAIFGPASAVDYAYAHNGVIGSTPYVLHDILHVLVGSVDLLVFLVFALMLSTVLRNTASAVGLSVALYLVTGSVAGIFSQLPISRQLWMDFIPFLNFDLVSDIFPFVIYSVPSELSGELMMVMGNARPGLLFSSVYLVILIFVMLLSSYDSFSRRDIK